MKRLVAMLVGFVSVMAPPVARADLFLDIGPNRGTDQVDAVVAPGSGEHFFDLTFTATDFNETFNELLYAYDVGLKTTQPGIRLLRVEKPDHWVFTAPDATLTFRDASSTYILAQGVNSSTGLSDIVTGSEVARVFYAVDEGAAPGVYRIGFDLNNTAFGTGNPNGFDIFPRFDDAGVVRVTPEPSGLAVLGAAAAFALRRCRPA
jgi:hypothetical protein